MAISKQRTRPGFEAVQSSYDKRSAHFKTYRDLATGELISRRQYLKRSENITSLEAKAARNRVKRLTTGERQPMRRYDAVVEQYKLTHPDAKVRGDSAEAKRFQKLYADLKKSRAGPEGNKRRLRVLHELGMISDGDYERYTDEG